MNKKVLNMKDKHSVIYRFMTDILGLEENEALKNTLKLESAISENVLKKFKCFIGYTNSKIKDDPDYSCELSKYLKGETVDNET